MSTPYQVDATGAPPPAVPDPRPAAAERPLGGGDVPAAPVAPAAPAAPAASAVGSAGRGAADPLLDDDPGRAADHAATENLLRCWLRETGSPAPAGSVLRVAAGCGVRLTAPVRHWSAAGYHRFGPVTLDRDDAPEGEQSTPGEPVDAVTVAVLLARCTPPSSADGSGPHGPGHAGRPGGRAGGPVQPPEPGTPPPHPRDLADLAGRVADSVRRTARFIAERRAAPEPPSGTSTFLDAEQALLLGHPLHPTPKSREGVSEEESGAYSPELRGAVRLHWFAVHPSVTASDSALPEPAARLTAALRGPAAPPVPPSFAALPMHPWQARQVLLRPECAALLDEGLLRDLGAEPGGPCWRPTSSVRTLHRPDAPFMLKLSLALRITNSRRENLRKELHRGVEVHRLLASGLADQWHAVHPGFDIVRDPAWLAVDAPGVRGLDVVLRDNGFGPHERAYCVAGLLAERPWTDRGTNRPARSRLGGLLDELSARTRRPLAAVATEWFERYLHAVVLPVLWLDGHAGIALEAHHQNSLLLADADGWPAGGRYRDNQGYYFRASRASALDARLPGTGRAGDTFVEDSVADERFAYYLGINHILGLVGAMGAQGLADEWDLLGVLRRFLATAATSSRSGLPQRLLDDPALRCKANLLTRLHGLDELDGPVEDQSVYVTIANPVAHAARRPAGRGA